MNKIHQQRIYLITIISIAIVAGTALILFALKQNINVFVTPSEIATANAKGFFRLGGVVKPQSVARSKNSLAVRFIVTDNKQDISVSYMGILPDLFREGKGVIVEGELNTNKEFIAKQVLAKHDENYMPKNVYQKLREQKGPNDH